MNYEIIPGSALVISDVEELNTSLQSLLSHSGYDPVSVCKDTDEADLLISSGIPELVIVDIPDGDLSRLQFAADVSAYGIAIVAVIDREMYTHYLGHFHGKGIYLLPKPISPQLLVIALDWLTATKERMSQIAESSSSVIRMKIDELKLINRAKWLLITELKMDEAHAHRYIEKQAMDSCISKKEVAQKIIKLYS